jgi:hypothetical protein
MTHIATSTDFAPDSAWTKSSYSSGGTGNCVEVATQAGRVGVRDSKQDDGPAFAVSDSAWGAFLTTVTADN